MAAQWTAAGGTVVYSVGITPLFYKLLNDANAFELLAQRLFWSVPLLLALRLLFRHRTSA